MYVFQSMLRYDQLQGHAKQQASFSDEDDTHPTGRRTSVRNESAHFPLSPPFLTWSNFHCQTTAFCVGTELTPLGKDCINIRGKTLDMSKCTRIPAIKFLFFCCRISTVQFASSRAIAQIARPRPLHHAAVLWSDKHSSAAYVPPPPMQTNGNCKWPVLCSATVCPALFASYLPLHTEKTPDRHIGEDPSWFGSLFMNLSHGLMRISPWWLPLDPVRTAPRFNQHFSVPFLHLYAVWHTPVVILYVPIWCLYG